MGKNAGVVLDPSPKAFLDLKCEIISLSTIFKYNLIAPSHSSGQLETSGKMEIQIPSRVVIKVPLIGQCFKSFSETGVMLWYSSIPLTQMSSLSK